MKLRVVIDTNIWIRILLKGRVTLPVLEAFNEDKFQLVMSQVLLDELHTVWNRPRLKKNIDLNQALRLERQLQNRLIWIDPKTIPPNCRDPKDLPVLATAIDRLLPVFILKAVLESQVTPSLWVRTKPVKKYPRVRAK
jgi:uncharacterized protein